MSHPVPFRCPIPPVLGYTVAPAHRFSHRISRPLRHVYKHACRFSACISTRDITEVTSVECRNITYRSRLRNDLSRVKWDVKPYEVKLPSLYIAYTYTGCTCTPRAEEKNLGAKFTGKVVSAPPRQRVQPPRQSNSNF